MYKLIALLPLFYFSIGLAQSDPKYLIRQDAKGKYSLINVKTNAVVFSKCDEIGPLKGSFENTDSSWHNFLLIRQKDKIELFCEKRDTIVFHAKNCAEITAKEIPDDNDSFTDLPKKTAIEFILKTKDERYLVAIFNIKKAKSIAYTQDNSYFTNDRKFIKLADGRKTKIVDLNGKIIFPRAELMHEFANGYVFRKDGSYWNEHMGVISKQGKLTVPPVYRNLKALGANHLFAYDTLERLGIITAENKIVFPFEYVAQTYLDTYAAKSYPTYIYSEFGVFVLLKSLKDGDFVIADTTGTILVPALTYKDVAGFTNERTDRFLEVTALNGLKGIYDCKIKKEIFTCEYTSFKASTSLRIVMELLEKGYKEAEKNGRWGLLNVETHKVQIPFEYDVNDVDYRKHGSLEVYLLSKEGKRGLVSISGDVLIPFIYDEIFLFYNNEKICRVKLKGLYGLYDMQNKKEILPTEFSVITENGKLEKIEGSTVKKGSFSNEGIITWDK